MLRVVNNKIPVSYICVNFFNILIQYLQQFLFCSQKKKNHVLPLHELAI